MAKNIQLVDIYIKIYNKQTLTMEDLVFLSMFDPDCFEKTCKNLIYNVPEAKVLLEPEQAEKEQVKEIQSNTEEQIHTEAKEGGMLPEEVTALLDNLKKMEWKEDVVQNIDSEHVKNLLGNLYMEMLFPHNDKYRFFRLEDHIESSVFNKKA